MKTPPRNPDRTADRLADEHDALTVALLNAIWNDGYLTIRPDDAANLRRAHERVDAVKEAVPHG